MSPQPTKQPAPIAFVTTSNHAWLSGNLLRGLTHPPGKRIFCVDYQRGLAEFRRALDTDPFEMIVFVTHHPFRFLPAKEVIDAANRRRLPCVGWNVDCGAVVFAMIPPEARSLPWLQVSPSEAMVWARWLAGDVNLTRTGSTFGIGAHPEAARVAQGAPDVAAREFPCLVPIGLSWCGVSNEEIDRRIARTIPAHLREWFDSCVEAGFYDLSSHPVQWVGEVMMHSKVVTPEVVALVGEVLVTKIQALRRLALVKTCLRYPVHLDIDVDSLPADLLASGPVRATFSKPRGQWATLELMKRSRSVLSLSFVNDLPHDRFWNALVLGAVPVVEDNVAYQATGLGADALLQYDFTEDRLHAVLESIVSGTAGLEERAERLRERLAARPFDHGFDAIRGLAATRPTRIDVQAKAPNPGATTSA